MVGRCFNDCTPETNGEIRFYNSIKDKCEVIFDVGARDNSQFFDFPREVHYFEPEPILFGMLELKEVANSKAHFNNFGLSDEENTLPYFNDYSSFLHRSKSVPDCPTRSEFSLQVRRGDKYMEEKGITKIDFLKIDTEGYEFKVIKGFGERIEDVKIIQFEYGGTYLDAGITLKEVVDYLSKWFKDFSYLHGEGLEPINYTKEHYSYCNIVCFRK